MPTQEIPSDEEGNEEGNEEGTGRRGRGTKPERRKIVTRGRKMGNFRVSRKVVSALVWKYLAVLT